MALTSALFTGLSGLNANQTKLNVIGNNIANTNTTAFKSSRAEFASQFYLTDQGGSAPNDIDGGSNPSQRGLGTQVASIEKDMDQGSLETTGKNTDLAIDGNGFFVVQGSNGQQYTRAGDFDRNADNDLTTSTGQFVLGYGVDDAGNIVKGKLQKLSIPSNLTSPAKATTSATLTGNLDASGDVATGAAVLFSQKMEKVSDGTIPDETTALTDLQLDDANNAGGGTPMFKVGDTLTLNGTKGGRSLTPLTYTIDATSTVKNLEDFYNQGLQIKTDEPVLAPPYDPAGPGAHIGADGVMRITANPGTDNAIDLNGTSFSSTNPDMKLTYSKDPNLKAVGESVYTNVQAFDSLGSPVNVEVTMYMESKTDAGTTWRFIAASPDSTAAKKFDPTGTSDTDYYGAILGSGTMRFDNTGKFISSDPTSLTLDRSGTGATPQQTVALAIDGITATATARSALTGKQDGYPSGTLSDFQISADGTISGSFTNDQTKKLGQLAIATFDNPDGLTDQGGNVYTTGPNSGEPTITAAQEMSSGTIRSGALEQSNVDISKEFINMIVASTGFTAASRVITTSDQLLTELMNTSR